MKEQRFGWIISETLRVVEPGLAAVLALYAPASLVVVDGPLRFVAVLVAAASAIALFRMRSLVERGVLPSDQPEVRALVVAGIFLVNAVIPVYAGSAMALHAVGLGALLGGCLLVTASRLRAAAFFWAGAAAPAILDLAEPLTAAATLAGWACLTVIVFFVRIDGYRRIGARHERELSLVREEIEQELDKPSQAADSSRDLDKWAEFEALFAWDLVEDKLSFSETWTALLGYADREIDGPPDGWFNLIHPDDLSTVLDELGAHLDGRSKGFECQHRIRRMSGDYCWVLTRGRAIRDSGRNAVRLVGSQLSLEGVRASEADLVRGSELDPLTGLANRARLMSALAEQEGAFAILSVEIESLPDINERMGREAGDSLLASVAERLQAAARDEDVPARLGGAAFLILTPGVGDSEKARARAESLRTALTTPFVVAGQMVTLDLGIGAAIDSGDPEQTLRDAEVAMHHAQYAPEARVQVYSAEMAPGDGSDTLGEDLAAAAERRELELHYQPLVSLESGRIVGAEALLHWQHGDELMPPEELLPLAEEHGAIASIGEWALREACSQNRAWQDAGLPEIKISIDVTPAQLSQTEFKDTVSTALFETDLDPRWLRLELTETALTAAAPRLAELKDLGVELLIDGFGAGQSSLDYLKQVRANTLKIAETFMADAADNPRAATVLASMVALARSLDLEVVVAGIAGEEGELNFLTEAGCDVWQGDLAVSAEDFQRMLEAEAELDDPSWGDQPPPAEEEEFAEASIASL